MEIIKEDSLEIISDDEVENMRKTRNSSNMNSNSKLVNVDDDQESTESIDEPQIPIQKQKQDEYNHMAALFNISSAHRADFSMKKKMSPKLKEATATKLEMQTSMTSLKSQPILIGDDSPMVERDGQQSSSK